MDFFKICNLSHIIYLLITCKTWNTITTFSPLRSSSLVSYNRETTKQMKHNVRKCLDPCLILVHFNPSFIHLLSLFFTSLRSSSPYHSFPHFLTPSWLLWPLNVSRWEDTTPIVIHPALSDHCVSALVNTPPLQLSYPLMTRGVKPTVSP